MTQMIHSDVWYQFHASKGLLHFRHDWLSGYAPHQLDQSVIQWTEACMPGNDGAKHTLWLDTRILLMWRHMNGSWHNGHDSELNWFFRITGSDGLHRGSAQKPTLLFCACGSAIAATALVPTQRSERLQEFFWGSLETTRRQEERILEYRIQPLSAFDMISWYHWREKDTVKHKVGAKSRLESLAMQKFCRKCNTLNNNRKSMPSLPGLLCSLHNCCRSTRVRCRAMASPKALPKMSHNTHKTCLS